VLLSARLMHQVHLRMFAFLAAQFFTHASVALPPSSRIIIPVMHHSTRCTILRPMHRLCITLLPYNLYQSCITLLAAQFSDQCIGYVSVAVMHHSQATRCAIFRPNASLMHQWHSPLLLYNVCQSCITQAVVIGAQFPAPMHHSCISNIAPFLLYNS
jgi:hypothetical protein